MIACVATFCVRTVVVDLEDGRGLNRCISVTGAACELVGAVGWSGVEAHGRGQRVADECRRHAEILQRV